ncbi:MAG: rhodanese-like domain-containing protein [Gammaproteobacteria bacterium]|nr:rhodanese-like domain-containing protein [Gammaproteobacteria bacterium]MCP5137438.1 rhodanese-like domain-containing protein [Gammaproteobacteria bacterium]
MKPHSILILGALLAAPAAYAANTADDLFDLDNLRVKITTQLPYIEIHHHREPVLLLRHQDPGNTISPRFVPTSRDCPPFCVQPMSIDPDVETIGELELIDYLKRADVGEDILIIDSRTADWTADGTIPGSINIPWTKLDLAHADNTEIADILKFEFGAIPQGELWDFSNAKTLVMFCNGPWCGQSPTNIRTLLTLGYPAEKLKWYRGGMQSWEQFGFTTVDP